MTARSATQETVAVPSRLSRPVGIVGWQAVATLVTILAGVVAAAVPRGQAPAAPGHLALLLAAHKSQVVSAHVAPDEREELSANRLRDAWAAAVDGLGPLRRVSRRYLVREGGGVQDELEVLQFSHGAGVLTARRTPAGITGLVLLVGAAADPTAAAAASAYAQDLALGRLQPVRARFDSTMTTALPAELFTAETSAATAGLQPPATVAGQIVVRRAGLTVIETYLLFRNGLRRIEVTLAPNGSIAGLYIRPL